MNETEEGKVITIKQAVLNPNVIPSVSDCKKIINAISFYMNEYEWDEVKKCVIDLKKVVFYNLIVKGDEKKIKKINSMFDDLIMYLEKDFSVGNNRLKYDVVYEKLIGIINEIGNYGLYVGQEYIKIDNPSLIFRQKIETLLRLYAEMSQTVVVSDRLIDEFLDICMFLNNKIIDRLNLSAKEKYLLFSLINELSSAIPNMTRTKTSKIKDTLSSLLTLSRIVMEREKGELFEIFEEDYRKKKIKETEEKEEEKVNGND